VKRLAKRRVAKKRLAKKRVAKKRFAENRLAKNRLAKNRPARRRQHSGDLAERLELLSHGLYEDATFSRFAGLAEIDGFGGSDLSIYRSVSEERSLWFDRSDAPLGSLCPQQYRRRARETQRPQFCSVSRPRPRIAIRTGEPDRIGDPACICRDSCRPGGSRTDP